jgi:predicted acylesterase/phospholipase RssA
VVLVKAERGNVAEAVAASASNPFLFGDVDVRRAHHLDAGADRVAAAPVHDACEAFPAARLIVINVTGRPAFYGPNLGCDVREVRVDVRFPPPRATRRFPLGRREAPEAEALRGQGEAFEAAYRAGHDAVMARSDLE